MNPVGNTGHSAPLGATVVDGGVNFSLYSRSATGVELLLLRTSKNVINIYPIKFRSLIELIV